MNIKDLVIVYKSFGWVGVCTLLEDIIFEFFCKHKWILIPDKQGYAELYTHTYCRDCFNRKKI